MDEFVTKDIEKRAAVVKEVLDFGGIDFSDSTTMKRAMAVFNVHSQAGTMMEKGSSSQTGKKFLTEKDRQELIALCGQIPEVGKPTFIVPGSLGTSNL